MVFPTFLVFAALAIVGCDAAPEVKIGKTTLVGRDISTLKQDFFGGMQMGGCCVFVSLLIQSTSTAIPFAEPPVANLRLRPPVLKTSLETKTFDASNFGPGCFQVVR